MECVFEPPPCHALAGSCTYPSIGCLQVLRVEVSLATHQEGQARDPSQEVDTSLVASCEALYHHPQRWSHYHYFVSDARWQVVALLPLAQFELGRPAVHPCS